jgi:hypothetical protein
MSADGSRSRDESPPPKLTPHDSPSAQEPAILCAKHQVPLEPGKISLTYQGHTFPVDVLCCPICGQALIPEETAKGRMLEVERTLEEK